MTTVRALFVLVCMAFFSAPVLANTGITLLKKQEAAIRPFTKPATPVARLAFPVNAPIAPVTKPQIQYQAQVTPLATDEVAEPGIGERRYYGIEAGITAASLSGGALTLEFPYPYDDIGRGQIQDVGPVNNHDLSVRFAIAGTLDLPLTPMISVQSKLGYRVLGSSGTDARNFYCFAVATNRGDTATFHDEYSLSLGMISLDVLGRFHLVRDGVYALAGFGFGGIVSASASASQRISSENQCQYTYSSSGTLLTGSFVSANDDIDLSDEINGMRFDLRAGAGTFIPIGKFGMVLVPEVTVGIPLTPFLSETTKKNTEALSLPYASLTVGIKIPWDYFTRVANAPPDPVEEIEMEQQQLIDADGKIDISGRVLNSENQVVDEASITVVDLSTNEVVATDKTENGEYSIEVNAPGRYSVTADAPGYLFGSTYYELDKDGRILHYGGDIRLARSADGRVRLLVFFDFNKADLQPSSYPELDRAVSLMKANPTMEVEIAGFTDSQGANSYNKDLSQRRANSVLDYLVRKGIERSRIMAIGYGEANPVADNDTEAGRAENRRVEFVVRRR